MKKRNEYLDVFNLIVLILIIKKKNKSENNYRKKKKSLKSWVVINCLFSTMWFMR